MLAVVSQPHILCLEREHCDLEASARLIKLTFSLNTEVAPPALWIAIKYKFEMVCTQYFNCNLGGCNYRSATVCFFLMRAESLRVCILMKIGEIKWCGPFDRSVP